MKRKKGIILIICVLGVCAVGVVLLIGRSEKLYRNLDASQIIWATVRLTPPDKTIQNTEIKELVEYLEDVFIYIRDD